MERDRADVESSADWGTGDLLRAAMTGKKPSETAAQSSAAAASLPWYIRYPTEAAGYGLGLVNLLDPVTDAAELGALGLERAPSWRRSRARRPKGRRLAASAMSLAVTIPGLWTRRAPRWVAQQWAGRPDCGRAGQQGADQGSEQAAERRPSRGAGSNQGGERCGLCRAASEAGRSAGDHRRAQGRADEPRSQRDDRHVAWA